MPLVLRIRSVLLIGLVAALAACGSGSGANRATNPADVTGVLSSAALAALPALETLEEPDRSRTASEVPEFALTLNGNEALLHSSEVTPDEPGQSATFAGSAGQLSWAIYRFAGIEEALKIGNAQALFASSTDSTFYLALSNYDNGSWDIFSSSLTDLASFKVANITADPAADYSSPAGNVHLAVLLWDGGEASLRFVLLGAGLVFDTVQGFSASHGGLIDSVRLSWDAFPEAQEYLIGYRLAFTEDPYITIAQPAGTATEFIHGPASPAGEEPVKNTYYEYVLQAKLAEGLYTTAVEATGYAGLAAPQNFVASYRANPVFVILRWDASAGATGYNLYRSDDPGIVLMALDEQDQAADNDLPVAEPYLDYTYTLIPTDGDGEALEGASATGALIGLGSFLLDTAIGHDGNLGAALFDGVPYFLDKQGDDDVMLIVAGRNPHPDMEAEFDQYPLESQVRNSLNVLAEVDGFPALACYDSDHDIILYGYADEHRPLVTEDWTVSNAIDTEDTVKSMDMADIAGIPLIVYEDFFANKLVCAFPADSTPQGPQDWTLTDITAGSPTPGHDVSLMEQDGLPAIAYHGADSKLFYAVATSGTPAGVADWVSSEVDTSSNVSGTDIALLAGRPAIAYQKPGGEGPDLALYFALSHVAQPQGPTDWAVMQVDFQEGYLSGDQPKILLLNGLPAIAHGRMKTTFDERLTIYSKAFVALPTDSRDWLNTSLGFSPGSADGSHAALALQDGSLGLLYGLWDDPEFSFDLVWRIEAAP